MENAERKLSFWTAQKFLATRASLGPAVKRVGIVLNANISALADAGKKLDDLVQGAFDRVETAMSVKLADFANENQRRAIQFFYAESRGIPAQTQVEMLIAGRDSSAVACAAAQQRHIPEPLQFALVEHCSQHPQAMRALAGNVEARPAALSALAEHSDSDVRMAVAAHISYRMKIQEPALKEEKQNLFDAIVARYEARFAPFLVPVCKNPEQIQLMFRRTGLGPNNTKLFVNNPYTPNDVLLEIASSVTARLMPGGTEAVKDARNMLEKRLGRAEESSAPEM